MSKSERRQAFSQAIQDAIADAIDDKVNIPWIVGMLEYYKASVTHCMMESVKKNNLTEEDTTQTLSE